MKALSMAHNTILYYGYFDGYHYSRYDKISKSAQKVMFSYLPRDEDWPEEAHRCFDRTDKISKHFLKKSYYEYYEYRRYPREEI